jgi:N-methylhydantoinase B
MTSKMQISAVDLEVVKASLSGIVQEMQNSLFRTGFSTIVRESQDASCALMNTRGEIIAQHVVLPLQIGAFPACCAAVIKEFSGAFAEGDAFIINHPYQGGSPHAPDMCVITPMFHQDALVVAMDRPPFKWGLGSDLSLQRAREKYLASLREADNGSFHALRDFARSL